MGKLGVRIGTTAATLAGGLGVGVAFPAAAHATTVSPTCPNPVTPALGANLISNPGAEDNPAAYTSSDGTTYYAPPDCWTSTGPGSSSRMFTAYPYAEKPVINTGYAIDHSQDPNAGNNFFYGGDSVSTTASTSAPAATSGSQTIDISSLSAGGDQFSLSAYLGGYKTQGDSATVSATFENAANSFLGSSSVGPVTAANRNNLSVMLLRSTTGTVPAGATKVIVTITMTEVSPSNDDGYADDLNLTITGNNPPPQAPEGPLAIGFPLAGLTAIAALLAWRRRRRAA